MVTPVRLLLARSMLPICSALVIVSVSACRRGPPVPTRASAAPRASSPDRLAEGEPPPGVEMAHDLVLPRGANIERRFGTAIYVRLPMGAEEAANWVRRQATDPEALIGPQGTVFPKVLVKGAEGGHHLRVEVNGSPLATDTLLVVDRIEETPLPPQEPVDQAMKKVGLTPDGKTLDPTHLD